MSRLLRQSFFLLLVMTVITGVLYPLAATGLAQLVFPRQANGSLIMQNGKPVGSTLIGQSFTDPEYFWGRPSATTPNPYNAASSSGSNQGPTNPALTDAVKQRIAALRAADPGNTAAVPVDLVTASASGLDPQISPAAAQYQAARVARVRKLDVAQVQALVAQNTEGRQLGVLGEPRVNVLELNRALDAASGALTHPLRPRTGEEASMSDSSRDIRADALLSTAQDASSQRLKIFLGAAPGVGKTFAMLSAARELKRQGVDVVVGLVETHGRGETAAMLEGLEVLPRRAVSYQERDFTEFDLDAALARKPAVILVDELAHTNLPGGRHARRWQDIAELLDAGIEVYTALNVQHLESLNDQVRRITGITVRETVPDAFLDRARDIVLVDLPPRELIGRLKQGKVYMPETAAAALDAFFSPTNLAALRELAVEIIAGHVDSDLREHMLARGSAMPVRRHVMATIDGYAQSEYLVRVARRIAERRGAPWSVVFVDTGTAMEPARRERLDAAMRLARRLGGESIILRGYAIADELLAHADREGVGQIILGRTRERPIARMLGVSLTQRLLRRGAHMELTIIATPTERARARRRLRLPGGVGSRTEYAYATLATVAAFALAFLGRSLSGGGQPLADLPHGGAGGGGAHPHGGGRVCGVAVFCRRQLLFHPATLHAGDRQRRTTCWR